MINTAELIRFYLPAHLRIDKGSLIQLLGLQLDKIITKELNREEEDLILNLSRDDNLQLNVEGFRLKFGLPLKIVVKKKVLGKFISIEGGIIIRWESKLELLAEDLFQFRTVVGSFSWIDDPILDMGAIAVPVKAIATTIIKSRIEAMGTQIDKSLNKLVSPKFHLDKFLKELYEGLKIGSSGELLITGEVEGMDISHFEELENKWLSVDIGLKGLLLGYSSDLPEFKLQKIWPSIELRNGARPDFHLFGHAILSYLSISKLLENALNHENGPIIKNGLKINDVDLKFQDSIIQFTAKISGKLGGKLHASFDGKFNPSKGNFELNDMELKFDANKWLDSVGFGLIKSKIQGQIHDGIQNLIEQQLPRIQQQILKVIEHQTKPFGIELTIDNFQMNFNRIDFMNDHLEAELESTGTLIIKCPDLSILNAYFN